MSFFVACIASSILFTHIVTVSIPQPNEWWYYACFKGSLFPFIVIRQLQYVAQQYGLYFYSHWGVHLLSRRIVNYLCLKNSLSKIIEFSLLLLNV
jgi:IS4 transposase